MKASELRIGNLIQLNPSRNWVGTTFNDPIKIESISELGINYSNYPEMGVSWDSLEDSKYVPIPITEDWLLKFGFIGSKYWKHHKLLFSIQKYSNGYYVVLTDDEDDSFKIDHIHQLQNLYFALTGEELQIK